MVMHWLQMVMWLLMVSFVIGWSTRARLGLVK